MPETVVDDPSGLLECCSILEGCPVVGLDTEFVGEATSVPELCLIQVAVPGHFFVIDPYACGTLTPFWQLLVHADRTVVVHAGREELRICERAVGIMPENVFDVQIAAGLIGSAYPISYANLVQEVLGKRVAKGATLTDWRKRPLSREQFRYAVDDVRHLLPLWENLSARLRDRNRLSWLTEETRKILHSQPSGSNNSERWRKLRGASGLSRQQLAVLRAIHEWREGEANELNRPVRTILRDDLIVELARRSLHAPADIRHLRGIGKVNVTTLFAAIKAAESLSPDDWPETNERETDPPQFAVLLGILGAVLTDWCQRQNLAISLVASGQDLKNLLRARLREGPLDQAFLLNQGWRRDHVLPELLAVLDGNHTLRIADPNAVAPLEYRPREPGE